MDRTQDSVVRLLEALERGNPEAVDELFELLYGELKTLAKRQRQRWQGDHTLNTTVLVHEAYLKLVGQSRIGVESRAHFLALAARAMRHILCNRARERGAKKRGGRMDRVSLDGPMTGAVELPFAERESETLVALDEALRRLEGLDPRQGGVVECRFFGGLTVEETATALGISPRTVKRDWAMAQAWLHREMTSSA